MYEIWFSQDDISHVTFKDSLEAALQESVKLWFDDPNDGKLFDYLVGPNGEILNNLVIERLSAERKRRKRAKDKEDGKNWIVEIRAAHLNDVWGIHSYAPNANAANGKADELLVQFGDGRVRVRELLEEG